MGRKKKETTKKEYEWSKYQLAIYDWIEHDQGHLVVEAAAGSGKSTTLVKCLDFISENSKVLLTAFNTDIVNELKKKVNDKPNVDIRTLQAILGHSNLGTTQIYTHIADEQIEKGLNANPLANLNQ